MTKKIFKSIGLIALAIAVAIGSFFVPINRNNNISASADTSTSTYSFNGSNLYVPLNRFYDVSIPSGNGYFIQPTLSDFYDYGIFSFSFTSDSDSLTLNVNGSAFYMQDSSSSNWVGSSLSFIESENSTSKAFTLTNLVNTFNNFSKSNLYLRNRLGAFYTVFYTNINSLDFNSNIRYVELGSDTFSLTGVYYPSSSSSSFLCNYIRYYDINNNYIEFVFPLNSTNYTSYIFEDRLYLLDDNLSENELYNLGYNKGLIDNQQNIYDSGYNTGFDDGFEDGKITGAIEANDYSFFSLFGAIFDAPVTLFTSLLNFEFLGINLWSFITSLLTLAIILFVVKLFIRR